MGSAVEGSAYDKVAQTGDAELLSMFSATSLVGVIGGLMVVNGIARGLGIVLMLGGIFLSVAITAGYDEQRNPNDAQLCCCCLRLTR
jgi:hypothetical protein